MPGRVVHGKVQNIFRIINDDHDDIDLTRAQAVRTLQQLRAALYPRAHPPAPKRKKKR